MDQEKLAELLGLSLLLEVSSYPKPGNVHRLSDNPGLKYEYFLITGVFSVKYFRRSIERGVKGWGETVLGDLVYGLVEDVVNAVSSNTCLGSSLLLITLGVGIGISIRSGKMNIDSIIDGSNYAIRSTTVEDSIYYYKAIRKASPSYIKPMDDVGDYVNVWDPLFEVKLREKGHRLIDILEYSSTFDIVAEEVVKGYPRSKEAEVFLRKRLEEHGNWNRGVVETYLYILSRSRDTVVFLKHGDEVAKWVSEQGKLVLSEIIDKDIEWMNIVHSFDVSLKKRGINPGSVADITSSTIAIYLLRSYIAGNGRFHFRF
ncbi:MAG: triphosphoribosyl-dephospho-CoA synthase [Desulfurococcaceae archaeon]